MTEKNNNSIPLESDSEWWWYKAKEKFLRFILSKYEDQKISRILEVGPGKGNNLKALSKIGYVDVLESDEILINYLKTKKGNLINSYFDSIDQLDNKYDLIILLDVIEHIKQPKSFLNSLKKNLSSSGLIIIGVPAYQLLWSEHDVKLKHYKRYSWKILESETSEFLIDRKFGFNFLLMPLRYFQIKFSNNVHSLNETSKLINKLLYFVSLIEFFIRKIGINPKFGLSLYVVLKNRN